MTLQQLIDFAKLSLNVNASQLNDDLTLTQWQAFMQAAYEDCWVRFRNQVSRDYFLASTDLQWTAGAATYTLPTQLQNAVIYDIVYLDTMGNPYSRWQGTFETRNVLRLAQFGAVTPSAFPFRVYYIPEPETLTLSSTPALIPPIHHKVIAWEALITVKELLDKEVPQSWMDHRDSIEMMLVKECSKRPVAARANIVSLDTPILRPSS